MKTGEISQKEICIKKLCNYCLIYCKSRSKLTNCYNTVGHIKLNHNYGYVLYNN